MLSLRTAKRESGWVAVLPHNGRIDLAHVLRESDRPPRLLRMESFDAGQNLAEALKSLAGSRKLKSFALTTLLSGSDYLLTQMDMPTVPAAERAGALRWRCKDMVDFPVETASIGVLDIPVDATSGRQAMVYVVMAGATAVGAMMHSFDAAKAPLTAIDIPELAQRNVAALFEQENRGLAFLSLDETGGQLTISYRGELYAVRRVEISASQLADADADRRLALLERVMLELQRTLDNFDRQYSFISVTSLLVTCCPDVPELQGYLAENLYVPVQQADLSKVIDLSAVPELQRDLELQARYLLPIGAALRGDKA